MDGEPRLPLAAGSEPRRVKLRSILRCPSCGAETEETMPTDACLFFHPCESCGTLLRPKEGDCCVFCSYGSETCPPEQLRRSST